MQETGEKQFFSFESQISDKERFKDAVPLSVRCMGCEGSFAFDGLLENQVSTSVFAPLIRVRLAEAGLNNRQIRYKPSVSFARLVTRSSQHRPYRYSSKMPFGHISASTTSGGRSVTAKAVALGRE